MKHGETLLLEIKVYDDGLIRGRHKDRKPLTDTDTEKRPAGWLIACPGSASMIS